MNDTPVLTIDDFESGRIDADSFDHETHVYMAWLYLEEHELANAIARFDASLKELTMKLGVPQKYHATITWLFLLLINERRRAGEDWQAFRTRNRDLVDSCRSTLQRYYSDGLLFSENARQHFVLPDRLAS